MKKDSLKLIYTLIFLLALVLYVLSVWRLIMSPREEWFLFVLSLAIMFLSTWGYWIVNEFIR